ncbi:gamma carbonic anhydrase family protein [Alphaproteobacteria bacterium]|nr:gamma carbonic anhydrase family protein [Alphaproteobacteria bacterium]
MRYDPTSNAAPVILPYGKVLPRIASDAFVAPGTVIIGDVTIGSQASIWFGCVLRGDEDKITIGARSNLQDGTIVHVNGRRQGTYIGDDVSVGHMALLHACTLEDGAYVGMGAQILDEGVVESGAMLAAGSLLTPGKCVKEGELWAGRPAKFMRNIDTDEAVRLRQTVENYLKRSRDYLALDCLVTDNG